MSEEKLKITRLIGLLEDICHEAQGNPLRLTAFNSPLLGLALLEIFIHNNPDQEDVVAVERMKYRQIVEDRRKREAGI